MSSEVGSASPQPASPRPSHPWLTVLAVATIAGIVATGILTAQPNAQQRAEGEALQALRWIRQAQGRYIADHGQPAATAAELARDEKYLSQAHAALFAGAPGEPATTTLPTATTYRFRMLPPGTPPPAGAGPVWGVIARPIHPPSSGAHQLFMTQQGKIYRHAEPPDGDPQRSTFLLDAVPAVTNEFGHVEEDNLAALGWTFVKQW